LTRNKDLRQKAAVIDLCESTFKRSEILASDTPQPLSRAWLPGKVIAGFLPGLTGNLALSYLADYPTLPGLTDIRSMTVVTIADGES
jgi:hypothetical protein